VSAWFASERWIYNHHQGKKWLGDVLHDVFLKFCRLQGIVHAIDAFLWSGARIKNASNSLRRAPSRTASFLSSNGEKDGDDTMDGGLPFTNSHEAMTSTRHRMSDAAQSMSGTSTYAMDVRNQPTTISDGHSEHDAALEAASSSSPKRGRFASAVRNVMMLQTASPLAAFSPGPQRQRTTSSSLTGAEKKPTIDPVTALRGSRVANLMPKLRTLEAKQDIAAHQGLVRHLQFSPDGKFLATSRCVLIGALSMSFLTRNYSWDRTSAIFRVGVRSSFSCLSKQSS
jgi:WD repeat-containing protein 26